MCMYKRVVDRRLTSKQKRKRDEKGGHRMYMRTHMLVLSYVFVIPSPFTKKLQREKEKK